MRCRLEASGRCCAAVCVIESNPNSAVRFTPYRTLGWRTTCQGAEGKLGKRYWSRSPRSKCTFECRTHHSDLLGIVSAVACIEHHHACPISPKRLENLGQVRRIVCSIPNTLQIQSSSLLMGG
jgi:hypothetical protein